MQYPAIPCNNMQYHASLITADGAYHCPVGSIMAIFLYLYYMPKSTTNQKSIIRTQRRKLCERACVRKYSGQDAEPRVCRFPSHSLYSPLPCLVFVLYSPRAYTVFLPQLYSSCIRTAPCCICCYIYNSCIQPCNAQAEE